MLLEPFWHMKPFMQYRSDIFLEGKMLQEWKYNRHELKCLIKKKSVQFLRLEVQVMQNLCSSSVTWSSECCPAENGTQGIPFKGWRMKLNGLLSTMTILPKSFDTQERSFTCSLYSLQLCNPFISENWQTSMVWIGQAGREKHQETSVLRLNNSVNQHKHAC